MHSAEIEEKDFEAPLYNQLLSGHRHIATPGQVFEGKFGIDAALEVLDPLFWEFITNKSFVPKGVILDHYNWGFIWRKIGRNRKLPTFSVNLLVQAKRPDVLNGVNSKLSPFGITGQYWRFKITPHQQNILEKVEEKLNNKCLIVYASPAFDTFDSLYHHTEAGTVVNNTNFVKVSRLKNHQSWNYNTPGARGVANIEPEEVNDPHIDEQIKNLDFSETERNNNQELIILQNTAMVVCEELSDKNNLAKHYLREYQKLKVILDKYSVSKEMMSYFGFYLFTDLLNLHWFCIGKKDA